MMMNKLTAQFFESPFPGWWPTQNFESVWQNFWSNRQIPFVELSLSLETQTSYHWAQNHDDLFSPSWHQAQAEQQAQATAQQWYRLPHCHGRWDLHIFGTWPQKKKLLDHSPDIDLDHSHRQAHGHALRDLEPQLRQLGMDVSAMTLARLDPGGWLEPHKDPITSDQTMAHVWIPLHHSAAKIKIWPWGDMPQQPGHVYLLNNQSFVHSIVNFDQCARYVVTARINPRNTDQSMLMKIQQALRQQWFE